MDAPPSAVPAADLKQRARQVLGEQIKIVYRYLPGILVINVIVGAAMLYGLWGVVPEGRLLAWGAAMLRLAALDGSNTIRGLAIDVGADGTGHVTWEEPAPPPDLHYTVRALRFE